MGLKQRISGFSRRFKSDTRGTMAVIWGVSLSAVVFAVGSAYDYSKISTARNLSQDAADMLALTASAYMRDSSGVRPTAGDQGFQHAKKYYLEDYDINLDPYYDMGTNRRGRLIRSQRPHFRVYYDTPKAGEVRVKIWGKTKPAFMSLAGVDIMDFSSASVVTYQVLDIKDPASVVLVLDNSGSMRLTDGDGVSRQDELESTVKSFMRKMKEIIPQDDAGNDENVLRTGLVSYWARYDPQYSIPMDWGTVSDSDVDALWAGGGTNSYAGMIKAKQWLDGEDAIHNSAEAATPTDNPLKFAILMTDGQNNYTSDDSRTESTCNAMKQDESTIIYTIGFAVDTSRSRNMLTNCASSPDHYYKAEDALALQSIFDNIGKDIVEETIRIRT